MLRSVTWNLAFATALLVLTGLNMLLGGWDRTAYASVPLCGGIPAPGTDCVCCEDCGCWYCND